MTAGCHFSTVAVDDIARDPVLGPALAPHAHWLLLQTDIMEAGDTWNAQPPHQPSFPIHDQSAWPLLPPGWTTPIFMIVRNSKVIDNLQGWRRHNHQDRERLVALLQRYGLNDVTRPPATARPSTAQR